LFVNSINVEKALLEFESELSKEDKVRGLFNTTECIASIAPAACSPLNPNATNAFEIQIIFNRGRYSLPATLLASICLHICLGHILSKYFKILLMLLYSQ